MQDEIAKLDTAEDRNGNEREAEEFDLSRAEIFDVLSNERRRWTLQYLVNNGDGPLALRDVVDHVTALENDVPVAQIDSTARKNVYTSLRQTHLPKLDDVGIIEFDPRRGQIESTSIADEVELYLEYVPRAGVPWAEYYLGLSVVGAGLIVLTYLGVPPFTGLSWSGLTFLLVGLFSASALAHAYRAKRDRPDERDTFGPEL